MKRWGILETTEPFVGIRGEYWTKGAAKRELRRRTDGTYRWITLGLFVVRLPYTGKVWDGVTGINFGPIVPTTTD
jgi:hypothetical protein